MLHVHVALLSISIDVALLNHSPRRSSLGWQSFREKSIFACLECCFFFSQGCVKFLMEGREEKSNWTTGGAPKRPFRELEILLPSSESPVLARKCLLPSWQDFTQTCTLRERQSLISSTFNYCWAFTCESLSAVNYRAGRTNTGGEWVKSKADIK